MRYPVPTNDWFSWAKRLVSQLERDYSGIGRGEVTLTPNTTSTVLTDGFIGPTRKLDLVPKTASAAAALPTTFIGTIGERTATITHVSDSQTDKTFHYVVI